MEAKPDEQPGGAGYPGGSGGSRAPGSLQHPEHAQGSGGLPGPREVRVLSDSVMDMINGVLCDTLMEAVNGTQGSADNNSKCSTRSVQSLSIL